MKVTVNAMWQEMWRGAQADFADLPGMAGGLPDCCASAASRRCLAASWGSNESGSERGRAPHPHARRPGSAFFVLVPYQAGMSLVDLSRASRESSPVLGSGAGTILKQHERSRFRPHDRRRPLANGGSWRCGGMGGKRRPCRVRCWHSSSFLLPRLGSRADAKIDLTSTWPGLASRRVSQSRLRHRSRMWTSIMYIRAAER